MNPSRLRALLERWFRRIRATHKGHYKDAAKNRRIQTLLGSTVVVLSALVSTNLFYSLTAGTPPDLMTFATGLVSAIVAALAALQTYQNYSGKQATHIIAATLLSSLKKKIELRLAMEDESTELKSFLREVRAEWDAITHGAPLMSDQTYSFVENKYLKPEYFDNDGQTTYEKDDS